MTVLLIVALLSSCGNSMPRDTTSAEGSSAVVETPPESTGDTTGADGFEAVRASGELWLSYGLSAYESGTGAEDLKAFFSDSANLVYLTLFNDMFTFDRENSIPVAEALFRFIFDTYGAEALTDKESRIEYKNAYLQSLGIEPLYVQSPEVESLLSSMGFSSNEAYPYIITFDNITYHFENFNEGGPSQYHAFLYYNTTGLKGLAEYLKNNDLDNGLNTDREFHYYVTFDDVGYSVTYYNSGEMYINDFSSALHEAVHAMGITQDENIWLSEGLCDYFGKVLGFNAQITAGNMQFLMMAQAGYFDERADAGDPEAIFYKTLAERYIVAGGELNSIDTFDMRLYTDLYAKLELEMELHTTLSDTYMLINQKEYQFIGGELTYTQAASFVAYLVEQFGIEKTLNACLTENIEGAFGMSYDNLKSDWMKYLLTFASV